MQTRTLYAILAATLLVPLGGAAGADEPEITYKITLTPTEQSAAPGDNATYRLVVESRDRTSIKLTVRSDALARLSSDALDVAPGEPASAALIVGARIPGKYIVYVTATSAEGETHHARALLHVREAQQDDKERRADALEARLEAMLARLEHALSALQGRAKPAARPPPPAEGVSVQLADTNVTLGPDGRRVAVLIEGGSTDARVPLRVRYADDTGWRLALEHEMVFVRAHERTFVWLKIAPGSAEQIVFAVTAGDAVAKGTASHPPARMS